jgi:hypothetical protein
MRRSVVTRHCLSKKVWGTKRGVPRGGRSLELYQNSTRHYGLGNRGLLCASMPRWSLRAGFLTLGEKAGPTGEAWAAIKILPNSLI